MAKKSPAKKAPKAVKKPAPKAPAKKLPAKKTVSKPANKPVLKKGKPVRALKPLAKPKPSPSKPLKAPIKKVTSISKSKTSKSKAAPKAAAKKPASKAVPKAPAKKPASKAAPKTPPKAVAKKAVANPKSKSKSKPNPKPILEGNGALRQQFVTKPLFRKDLKLSPFLAKQRQRLLMLKDTLLDSMTGVARGNLHAGSETSAFGMHQADAGSDAYDRDFALSILSQEQNSLYEIDEALKRIDDNSYGQCEICNKAIPHIRLEARPFTRYTVDCQEGLEKRQYRQSARLPINSLFGLTEEESEADEEETTETS